MNHSRFKRKLSFIQGGIQDLITTPPVDKTLKYDLQFFFSKVFQPYERARRVGHENWSLKT